MGAANPTPARRAVLKPSLQLCVLRLGLLQDGNVGVGVFPERKEVLIGALCFGCVAVHCVGATKLKLRERTQRKIKHDTAMVQKLLELSRCRLTLTCKQVSLTAQI